MYAGAVGRGVAWGSVGVGGGGGGGERCGGEWGQWQVAMLAGKGPVINYVEGRGYKMGNRGFETVGAPAFWDRVEFFMPLPPSLLKRWERCPPPPPSPPFSMAKN